MVQETVTSLRRRFLEEYTEEELERLGMCHPGRLDDTLQRYLVARNNDEEEALKMLRNSVKWRIEIDMPMLMSGPALPYEKLETIRRFNPQGFHKCDKYGHHIYIERTGYMDVSTILQTCTEADVIRTHTQKVEYHFNVLGRKIQSTSPKIVIIYDLSNIGFNTFRPEVLTAIKHVTSLNQNHYPETLHKVYIVNAPYFFYAIHRMIEIFLPEIIRNKIGFLGNMDELLNVVDAENLPAFLGGKCQCFSGQEHDGCISSKTFTKTHFFNGLDHYFENKMEKS